MKYKNKNLTKLQKFENYLFGTIWVLFSIIIFLSVISYNELDISFNNISSKPQVNNYLGKFGSYTADIFMQLFGYSSFIFAYVFFILGLNIFRNKILYNKIQKTIACIFLILSSSIIFDIILSYTKSGGIIGYFIVNSLYYLPQYLILLIVGLIFFISISFVLDIKKRWWIVKNTRLFMYIKKICINIYKFIKFLYILFTTKNFRDRIRNIFAKIMNRYDDKYIYINEEQNEKLEDNNKMEENEEDEDPLEKSTPSNKKRFFIFKNKADNVDNNINDLVFNKKINKVNNKDCSINYNLPTLDILNRNIKNKAYITQDEIIEQSKKLIRVLNDFGVKGTIINAKVGPIVTLFEFEPSAGTKSSRIIGLSDDIARSMSAVSTRISIISGRNAIGIELPNKKRETIYIRDMFESEIFKNTKFNLPIVIGKNIIGDSIVADLSKMPHLLVAGTTGSGKSVAINAMITSLLYKFNPDQCKFIMIDPKMLELSVYEGIPHLLTPVVIDPVKAVSVLKWVCQEMEDRYRIMTSLSVRNIAGYNEKLHKAMKDGKKLMRTVQTGFDAETDEPIYEEREIEEKDMPYIVVIVDEMADLMITSKKEIEASIQRIAQKARAAGIHIIMATQRPSVDVITGVIKANFPARISFQVVSKYDSKTILGEQGAEQLLGMGDMLFMENAGKINRAHGPFVSDDEVERIVEYIKSQGFKPTYVDNIANNTEFEDDNISGGDGDLFGYDKENDLYNQALNIIMRDKKCSISYIQRQLRIGYNKAANIIEEMERKGVLTAPDSQGKRQIIANH